MIPYTFHGHAIISADDRIADATGVTPPSLRNESDWRRFQAALDVAAVTVLGRLGHEANPNVRNRNRLVVSTSARGVERRDDSWWWNPAGAPVGEALAAAAPEGGIVAIPGGRRVFDIFLAIGFDAFHLARAHNAVLGDGVRIFSAVSAERSAEAVLAEHGLVPGPVELLDEPAGVSFTVWRRA